MGIRGVGVSKVPSGDGWLGPSEVAPSDVGRLVLLAGTARSSRKAAVMSCA